jgi:hypothetical protein
MWRAADSTSWHTDNMHIDANIGGSSGETGIVDLAVLMGQISAAHQCGFDGFSMTTKEQPLSRGSTAAS